MGVPVLPTCCSSCGCALVRASPSHLHHGRCQTTSKGGNPRRQPRPIARACEACRWSRFVDRGLCRSVGSCKRCGRNDHHKACGSQAACSIPEVLCPKCEVLHCETLQASKTYAQTLAATFLTGCLPAEGFEEDPLTYLTVGWPRGRCPTPHAGKQLAQRLAKVILEDAPRLVAERRLRDEGEREACNRQAVDSWFRRKAAERRAAAGISISASLPCLQAVCDPGSVVPQRWQSADDATCSR